MKLAIYGVVCPECKGNRFIEEGAIVDGVLELVVKPCPRCNGEGVVQYDGDRTGVEWERE